MNAGEKEREGKEAADRLARIHKIDGIVGVASLIGFGLAVIGALCIMLGLSG